LVFLFYAGIFFVETDYIDTRVSVCFCGTTQRGDNFDGRCRSPDFRICAVRDAGGRCWYEGQR